MFLHHAIAYAQKGWRVHPLPVNQKFPPQTGWKDLATADSAAVETLWKNPNSNIAIACGNASKLSKEARSRLMSKIKGKNTSPERVVRSVLHAAGFRFRIHPKVFDSKPDIFLSKYHTAVFINGCFWHGHSCSRGRLPTSNQEFWQKKIKSNKVRDENQRKSLKQKGLTVITLWECSLKRDIPKLLRTLQRVKLRLP